MSVPVGLVIFDDPQPNCPRFVAYADYLREVVDHAGLCYRGLSAESWPAELEGLAVLVTVGEASLEEDRRSAVESFVRRGGTWISVAGLCGLASVLGLKAVRPTAPSAWGASATASLGECYLAPEEPDHPALRGMKQPLHGFGGLAAVADGAHVLARVLDKHQRATDRVAVSVHSVGQGQAVFVGVDLPGTLVRIQQGTAVTRDGVSSPDGAGALADGVLKSDDGMALDWLLDRTAVPGVKGASGFLEPMADRWRQVLLGLIFDAARRQRVSLPLLWYWPDRLPAVAHLSFDTDGNDPRLGRALLELCQQAGVVATWCVIAPGYGRAFIRELAERGHELAMHYDAVSRGRPWSHEQFLEQHAYLTELFDGRRPVSNKNHYLRWEGDAEFYRWLEEVGIELDQSKGTSKSGEFGFNFGTCHPFFPLDEQGRRMNVLELPTQTQDLGIFVAPAGVEALLASASAAHGVLHLLFHPAHMDKPSVREALLAAADLAREAGLAWWTAAQINAWQRARRDVVWRANETGELRLTAGQPLAGATLLWLDVGETPRLSLNNQPVSPEPMRCWGFDFHSAVVSLDAGEHRLGEAIPACSGTTP